uniref:Uncharacterized protein n=1 Tax=Rhizophora mucronata TaxID=61149 RepID=A0A2P2R254_RHIMU
MCIHYLNYSIPLTYFTSTSIGFHSCPCNIYMRSNHC